MDQRSPLVLHVQRPCKALSQTTLPKWDLPIRTVEMETSMLQPGIFNTPRPKRPLLPNPNKKRKIEHKVEEISFDNDARADYLTGFHKRKVERAKRAKAEAEKKMREERVVVRKQVCILT